MKANDIVAPKGDGEDDLGRVLKNTNARFRVLAVDGAQVNLVLVRPGGMFRRPGGRLLGADAVAFRVTNDIADRPVEKRKPSLREHVAEDAGFELAFANHLAHLSRC